MLNSAPLSMAPTARRTWRIAMLFAASVLAGCAGPAPRSFPPAPLRTVNRTDGSIERWYDPDGDGKADVIEVIGVGGRVERVRYDVDHDGAFALERERRAFDPSAATRPSHARRHLLIIVDSVPYAMVRQFYDQGRFRLFYPPGRTISPFPVMTDPALAEFFGVSPLPGVEAQFFDGSRLTDGVDSYLNSRNMQWLREVDYALPVAFHGPAYLWPGIWFDDELRHTQDRFLASREANFAAYSLGGSSMGSKLGRDGHQTLLVRLDRFCQWMMHHEHGDLDITLMSDHGHYFGEHRRVPLAQHLSRIGYQVRDRIDGPGDVVVPEWGLVSCAVIHTRTPERVARDVVGFEGVELAAYLDEAGTVVVIGREGVGRIEQRDGQFRYTSPRGDPLNMLAIVDRLNQSGQGTRDGWIEDRVLLAATASHEYPDAVQRLWRAFHGLFEHTPDVFVSLQNGYFAGSERLAGTLKMRAVHGNLRSDGSCGFIMSTLGPVPTVQRIGEAADGIARFGVEVRRE